MKPNRTRLKVRLAVRHVPSIKRGLRALVSVEQILDAWFATQDPIGSTEENARRKIAPQFARDWVQIHARIQDTQKLRAALGRLYADSWVLGEDLTTYELARALRVTKAAPSRRQLERSMRINWNQWKPGNRAAARLLSRPRGLERLLQEREIVIRGISRTALDRIGTRLADGLARGDTRESLAASIEAIVGDAERALVIAGTEGSRAVIQASMDLYRDSGVEMVEYLVADPCDLCQENYEASPQPIGEPWPAGDPPVHPNCMCDLAPYVVDTSFIRNDE